MTAENLTAKRRIDATPRIVFAVLADPANHAAIDGTGWVRGPRDEGVRITAEGDVFDMAMFHPQHPDGDYDLAEVDGQTDVTLTYDWSNATPEARERFQFPPFGVDKLTESLDNLATLVP